MRKFFTSAVAGLLVSTAIAAPAFAGGGADLAKAHFEAIAAGLVDKASEAYTDTTKFQWIGGPLDGEYTGKADIAALWTKFSKAQGKLTAEISDVKESANPKGVTVTANVKFVGKNTIPVRYVLTYRGDDLVNETWQIDPNL